MVRGKGRGDRQNETTENNLVGRVGRIEYNLYGNVFLARLEENVKKEDFISLLKEDVPEQKLSLVSELSKNQKKLIIRCLLEGNIELLRTMN